MRSSGDGGSIEDHRQKLVLVLFDNKDKKEESSMLFALKNLLSSLEPLLQKTPLVTSVHASDPPITDSSVKVMYPAYKTELESIGGNVILGVTYLPLFDPILDRNIFGQGIGFGIGLFSLKRFQDAGASKSLYYSRISKEIIKILGLSCRVFHCQDMSCIMARHYTMEDLDLNTGICPNCLQLLAKELNETYLSDYNEDPSD